MTQRSVEHSTFVIERVLPGRPQYAFRFWSDPALKQRWAGCHPDWTSLDDRSDFRVGGSDVQRLRTPDGVLHAFHAYYLDIVEGERLIYAYEMSVDGRRISSSMATVQFAASGSGTIMTFTEQVAFLDGLADLKTRSDGTEQGFERLALELERELSTVQ